MKNESSYFNEKQYRYDLSGLFSLKRRIERSRKNDSRSLRMANIRNLE